MNKYNVSKTNGNSIQAQKDTWIRCLEEQESLAFTVELELVTNTYVTQSC